MEKRVSAAQAENDQRRRAVGHFDQRCQRSPEMANGADLQRQLENEQQRQSGHHGECERIGHSQ